MNATLNIINRRRSTRDFLPTQIKENELQAILKAGIYAPYGDKDSRIFTVIQNKRMIERINQEAKDAVITMELPGLKQLGTQSDFNCFYGAPTVALISGSLGFPGSSYDCAAAAENMLIAAESIDIGSCWIHFSIFAFNVEKGKLLQKALEIPEGFEPMVSVALGYKGNNKNVIPQREMTGINYIR